MARFGLVVVVTVAVAVAVVVVVAVAVAVAMDLAPYCPRPPDASPLAILCTACPTSLPWSTPCR